jgi:hypothetical protein
MTFRDRAAGAVTAPLARRPAAPAPVRISGAHPLAAATRGNAETSGQSATAANLALTRASTAAQ